MNYLEQMMQLLAMGNGQQPMAQVRAPNTLQLRNIYGKALIDAEGNLPPFEEWVRINYPDMKILNQQPQGLLGQ